MPGVLFADDTSLISPDVEGLKNSHSSDGVV